MTIPPRMKGESNKMHHRLAVFATTGQRDYQKTADILNEEMSQMSQTESQKKKITPEVLRKNAERWAWSDRLDLEKAKNTLDEALELDEEFKAYNKKIISILQGVIDYLEDVFQKIYDNENDYALSTLMNLLSSAMNTLDKAIYNYRLSCGQSTDNKELHGDLAHNVNAIVQEETKLVYSKEVRERIQNISDEPDEETQQFLDSL